MIMLGLAMLEQRKTWFRLLFFSKSLPGLNKHSMSFVKTSPVVLQVRPSAVCFSLALTFQPIRGQSFGMLSSDWLERKLEEKLTFESPWYVAVCQRRLFKSGEVIIVGVKPIRTMHEWAFHGQQ